MPAKSRTNREETRLVYELIFELTQYFELKDTCEMCLKKMRKPRSGFTIHHLEYRKGEKTHKNFLSRLKYYLYLKPIIKKAYKDGTLYDKFAFLCNQCHHSLDGPRGLTRRKKMNVLRMIMLWYRTKT